MIHFVPPHNDKVRSRVPELAATVDVVLGNLEDAVPVDQKEAARKGFVAMAQGHRFRRLRHRIVDPHQRPQQPLDLDDLFEIVSQVGDKLDVVMVPKVEGPWDIHYIDQLLAQLEAKHGVSKPILVHAILETAEGVANVDAIASASRACTA